jgi:opacity protein-like surface antigen
MRKSFVLFLFAAISFITFQNTQAQGLDIGIGGGLSIVQTPSYYTDVAGFSSEYHIGLKGKLNLPVSPITPIGFVEYHFFRGSESTPTGNSDTKQNILSIGVGGEYSIIPGPLSPYLGVDIEFNNLGDLTTSGSQTSSGVSRMGLGVGAGVMFKLLPVINLDLTLKYQMLNLFGKIGGEDTIGLINLNAAIFF